MKNSVYCKQALASLSLVLSVAVTACSTRSIPPEEEVSAQASTEQVAGDSNSSELGEGTPEAAAASRAAFEAANGVQRIRVIPSSASEQNSEGGIEIIGEEGTPSVYTFGTEEDTVKAAISSLLGEPVEEDFNADCRQSYAVWSSGLTMISSDRTFQGWSVSMRDVTDAGADWVATENKVGIGTTLSEITNQYSGEIELLNGTTPMFVTEDGLVIHLTGEEPSDIANLIRSGLVCID